MSLGAGRECCQIWCWSQCWRGGGGRVRKRLGKMSLQGLLNGPVAYPANHVYRGLGPDMTHVMEIEVGKL